MEQKDLQAISKLPPFSFISAEKMEELFPHFSTESHEKEKILFVQETSQVEGLYIIHKGAAERYFEHKQDKILKGVLSEWDYYGGISILVNDGVAVRTLKLIEDTDFFVLNKTRFLELCAQFQSFKEYFTNAFGRQMLDKAYAGIIARQIKTKENALHFFNQPVASIHGPNLVTCPYQTSIKEAARKMAKADISSIFIKDEKGKISGIVTDSDFKKRAVAAGVDTSRPAREIMSTPLVSLPADAQVFEAFLMMLEEDINHLAVANKEGETTGVLTDKDLMAKQGQSIYFLIKEIRTADTVETLADIHKRLPRILLGPIKNGMKPENLTRLITTFADSILNKIIEFAIEKVGTPPCDFVFIVMGSEGRREQTLKTDQDNAIIFEDIEDKARQKEVQAFFLELADCICTWLDQAGYDFCDGDNMAKNPKWCQPLSVWKNYFFDWIHTSNAEDLLYSSIFFDFRGAWGSRYLADELHAYLFKSLEGWAGFFRNLTENALYFKPPLGFFRNILVQSKGEHKDAFDIKRAMLPITDFARIFALKNSIAEANTLARLFRLYTSRVLNKEEYNDIVQAYQFLMNLRFVRQITAVVDEERKPDNFITPKNLSRLDKKMLKEIFIRIDKFQQKLSIEIRGFN